MNVRAYPRRVDWMALTMGFGATDTTWQSDRFTEWRVDNFGSRAPRSSFLKAASHLTFGWLAGGSASAMTMYRVTDRLHQGRTVAVPGHEIAPTVSAWLAELGVGALWQRSWRERHAPATGRQHMRSVSTYPSR